MAHGHAEQAGADPEADRTLDDPSAADADLKVLTCGTCRDYDPATTGADAAGRKHAMIPRRIALTVALASLLAVLPAGALQAGWKIQERDPEFPDEVTTFHFQGGKARVDGALEGLAVIVDVKRQEGWIIEEATKRYAGGPLAKLEEELKVLEAAGLPEDDELRGDLEAGYGPGLGLEVVVKDLGPGERILGHETRRHQVFVDGELLEELWIAPSVDVEREIDPVAFAAAMQRMLGGGGEDGYEEAPAYRKLRAAGYPLRQVLHYVGEKSVLEVRSAEKSALPESDFTVPKGHAPTGYMELLVGEE